MYPKRRTTAPAFRYYFLVALLGALVLRWFVRSSFSSLPYDFRIDTQLEGEVRVLELVDIDSQNFPLKVKIETEGTGGNGDQVKVEQKVSFESALSKQSMIVREVMKLFLDYANIKEAYWDKLKLAFGDEEVSSSFWVDRQTARYVTPAELQDFNWILPLGRIKPETYTMWESVTGSEIVLEFVAEEKLGSIRTYKYQAQVGSYDLGSFEVPSIGQRVRLDASGLLEIWAEKNTGIIVASGLDLNIFAQMGLIQLDVLQITFDSPRDGINETYELARKASFWYKAGGTWLPVLLVLSGFYAQVSLSSGRVRSKHSRRSVRRLY